MHSKEIFHLQIPPTDSVSKIITRYGFQSSLLLLVLFLAGSMFTPQCFAATVIWDASTHFLGDGGIGGVPVTITVNDPAANTPSIDHIQVHVISTSDPSGIPLNLTETGANTGIFKNTNFIFYTGDGLIPIGRTVTISISDPAANTHSTTIDTLSVAAQSTSDPAGLFLTFSETGINTGIFSGKITFATVSASSGSTLNVHQGDEVTIRDTSSSLSANAIITPNPDAGFGAILAKIGDTVTVTYQGISANTVIGNDTFPGGGGGGLIAHPGLVLDAIAGLFAVGGSPYIVSPPSFGGVYYHFSDGLTLTQGNNKTTFDISHYNQEIPKQVMVAGEKVNMTFKTFESYYAEGVIHMGLYIIPRNQDIKTINSIAFVEWQKGEPVKVKDSNNILRNVTASSNSDGKYQYTQFSFIPTKSYDKMSFLVRAWNDHMYDTDVRIHDAVEMPLLPKTLPAGVIKYDNFTDLQAELQRGQFYKPAIMAHIHDTSTVFPNSNGHVYWLYDTINHTVTLIVSDANDSEVFSYKSLLQPYAVEKKGDYKFMYFTVKQLNRWDVDQIKTAMKSEEEKAMSVGLEKRIIPQSNW